MNRDMLLVDLKQQVKNLEVDLRERAAEPQFHTHLDAEYQSAKTADRIAATYPTWLDGQVTQAAAAWVLGTVFLRFCEDNRLIQYPYLAAAQQERREIPVDRQHEFFGAHPDADTYRDWILAGFDDMSISSPVAAGLFDPAHNPMWRITPSNDAAKELVRFWRLRGDDGALVHDFTDPQWDTRFLGDLYQDLSESARKNYALLQTPEFVEEFILDLTLTPAMDEFGLEPDYPLPKTRANMPKGLRVIDPACGSGHFLLGAFHRLLAAWQDRAPGAEPWELIRKVLYSVHGVDKNPFAVAIARFRLFLAAMKAADAKTLHEAPEFPLHIAVGDSLLHGRGATQVHDTLMSSLEPHTYVTEDIYADRFVAADVLGKYSYHVVVGNPPYITVKDKQENANYRKAFKDVCRGQYALAAPFAARFFELGVKDKDGNKKPGHIGQITANSFMKREFGKDLIEMYFNLKVDLTHVIDTSGAYIPGHGTPTVILIGRNVKRFREPIRVVQGIQGEPAQPEDPSRGLVWQAIIDQVYRPGSESQWVSADNLERQRLAKHPWSLSGGGALELWSNIESDTTKKLKKVISTVGSMAVTREDDVYVVPPSAPSRLGLGQNFHELGDGECLRDWQFRKRMAILFPYDTDGSHRALDDIDSRHYWKFQQHLGIRKALGGTQEERGLPWYEFSDFHQHRWLAPLKLVYSGIATHPHFVLDRGERIFNRWAPVIKLPEGASEDDHLELLGVLNSSAACFWLKQVCHDKGNGGIGGGIANEEWERFFEFTGTKLQEFPLPSRLPLESGRRLDVLARRLSAVDPGVVAADATPMRARLDEARDAGESLRAQMIAAQEELDWEVYGLYGLLDESEQAALTTEPDTVPEVGFGERAFEIVLARKMAAGQASTEWFNRHGAVPVTKIPEHWPESYRAVVQRRIDCIESRRDIALMERRECKRRWSVKPWQVREEAALRDWLLDACERRDLWFEPDHNGVSQPRVLTVNQLADRLRSDSDVVAVAQLYAGPDTDLAKVLADLIDAEHVPYVAALRYKDSGLRKRAQWEETWRLQREEDRTGTRIDIAVPPKYGTGDFRKTSYWRHRGKLDVPKERFISYPLASPDNDSSLLLGWAGWDHRQAAHALTMLAYERAENGWGAEKVAPLLAGLAEQVPWLRQWHHEVDPELGTSPAELYADFLAEQQQRFELSEHDLSGWRPPATARRKTKKQQTKK